MAVFGEQTGTDFQPCPEGRQFAKLVDVVDMGWQETSFEGKPTGTHPFVKFVWETAPDDNAQTFVVFDRKLKMSSHEKAALRKQLDGWLGKKFVETEFVGREWKDILEGLIGRLAVLQIEHREYNGDTYANVVSCNAHDVRYDRPVPADSTYVRRHLRENWDEKRPAVCSFDMKPGTIGAPPPEVPRTPIEMPTVATYPAISSGEIYNLNQLAIAKFGMTLAEQKLEHASMKAFKKPISELDSNQAGELLHKLGLVKATAAALIDQPSIVAQRIVPLPPDDDSDPFADQ